MYKDSHQCKLKNPTIGDLNSYYNVGSSCKTQHLSVFSLDIIHAYHIFYFLSQCGSSVLVDHLKMSVQR